MRTTPLRSIRFVVLAFSLGLLTRVDAEEIRVPVTRDTWLSNVGSEAEGSNGGSGRLKVKSIQELTLLDFDPAPLRGRVIRKATLHLKPSGGERLWRMTVGTVNAEWEEGTATGYAQQKGVSTFHSRRHPDLPWAEPGSDLTAVILGHGHSRWKMADAFPPDAKGWQRLAVEPAVLAARAAGLAGGLVLFDDQGSEWKRDGEKFEHRLFPNRFLQSRESGREQAPYFTVELGPRDDAPPAAVGNPRAESNHASPSSRNSLGTGDNPTPHDSLRPDELRLNWTTPADQGEAGTIGFEVTLDGRPAPRWLTPQAGRTGEVVSMLVRDIGLAPGAEIEVGIRAVDAAGNRGPLSTFRVKTAEGVAAAALPLLEQTAAPADEELLKLGDADLTIVDLLDKPHPLQSHVYTPKHDRPYLSRNHLWRAVDKQIELHAARNEFTGFTIVVSGPAKELSAELTFDNVAPNGAPNREWPKIETTWAQPVPVATPSGPAFDPLVPAARGRFRDEAPLTIAGQVARPLVAELYVPHTMPAGVHAGRLVVRANGAEHTLALKLNVERFTLPDYLSFLPEMNCYGLPANERDYYRMAHRHRTVVNRVPYSQRGEVSEGCAPKIAAGKWDWSEWDARFGPLLDGSAMNDLPRRGVPLECFYLPWHENWPLKINDHFGGGYWADETFTETYRAGLVEAARELSAHCLERGWNDTLFHGFLNNKVDFKRNGWSRASSPWLLDEPSNWHDYWALKWYGEQFHEGVRQAHAARSGGASDAARTPAAAHLLYRCDISRPEWQRDSLDHLLDYNVVQGGAYHRYRGLVSRRQADFNQVVVVYGSSNPPQASNIQPAAWCWDNWLSGADGVVPWQTVGTDQSWRQGEDTCLFYPGKAVNSREPIPSWRLKSYLRGQQDVEYFTWLATVRKQPRWQVAQQLLATLKSADVAWQKQQVGTGVTNAEDAGRLDFGQLKPGQLERVRRAVAKQLDAAAPAPQRRLRDWPGSTPRPPQNVGPATGGYVSTGDFPPRAARPPEPKSSPIAKKTKTIEIQGKSSTSDAVIDPATPQRNVGAEPRDNRLYRNDSTNAMLIRFDVRGALRSEMRSGADTGRLRRATLTFYVWDPSSQGRTKIEARPLRTEWDEASATWEQPAAGKKWRDGKSFAIEQDCGPPLSTIVVESDPVNDIADPPIAYSLDITAIARDWVGMSTSNHGVAVCPVIDRSIDEGQFTRFQVTSSEYRVSKFAPKLTLELEDGG